MGNPGTGTIRSGGRLRAEARRAGETDTESVIPLGVQWAEEGPAEWQCRGLGGCAVW